MNKWNNEYKQKGIPSSYRESPSGVLTWALNNAGEIFSDGKPASVLDVGCGTGRNTAFMANQGIAAVGLDISEAAIESAHRRNLQTPRATAKYFVHDLTKGLPFGPDRFDLVTDIFVYKHQISSLDRRNYRKEIARVLSNDGKLLLSLATRNDGYYSGCPSIAGDASREMIIFDTVAEIESILFDLEELIKEMSDHFKLEMSWCKTKPGLMHGKKYMRETLATIWGLKG